MGRAAAVISAFVFAVIAGLFQSTTARAESELPFPRPASLEPNINFWVDIFTSYDSRDLVVHDRDEVWRIYQVFRMPGSGDPTRRDLDWAHAYLRAKWTATLDRLATGSPPSTSEERKVAEMFKGHSPAAYSLAADNLRIQQGLQDRFREGLLRSRYYRPSMERIFRTFGLPPELVTLASVESGFSGGARSSAGAVGIWQFTRGTGQQYMKINRHYDERLNPTRETQAAAQLLRSNYDSLGSWPLAITAYNYGTAGMERAAAAHGNDYEQVFEQYKGPRFGFASRNYYAEFLAALQVHRYEDKYFPGIKYDAVAPPRIPSAVLKVKAVRPHKSRHPILKHVSTHLRRHKLAGSQT